MKITLQSAIQQFLIDQELKGNTKSTLKYYSFDLRYLAEFLGNDKLVSELTINDLNNYLLSIKNRPRKCYFSENSENIKDKSPVTSVTVQTYIRAVRSFLGYLYREGYISENLQAKFKLPKATKKAIEILSDEEIEKIFKCFDPNTSMGLRNMCLIALMVDCGLRRNEALELEIDNIHITQGIIKVLGKGQKERIVPIGLYTKKLLIKYLNGFRPTPEYETKRLFLDRYMKPLTENGVKLLFNRIKAKTGITRLHPHILRHTFATKYIMNGGDIISLQQILGHTSLDMVKKYSHLASAYLLQAHSKFAPLDNIERNKYKLRYN
ncbi:tyrosine-type recombinase/integrase [Clostridium thermosuccinogenes]|uniref:tyrosine-type recombinase/integrase n=1 Tax=Clostridium thermosuccinogenes TaxID=84032 RepID=UPI0013794E71|nr:tyrosine-type recombinase/integrase [Pseudoclostridium thermosuccinogenes]